MKNILVICCMLMFSCKQVKKIESPSSVKLSKLVFEDEERSKLLFECSNGRQGELELEGKEAVYLISPDSQRIAVNYRILSNLQITKIYSLNEQGTLGKMGGKNISSQVWDSIEQLYKIDREAILFPKTSAEKWGADGTKITVLATGNMETGERISKEFEIGVEE